MPDDLRAGYILLKNAGYLPEELELNKEIVNLGRRAKNKQRSWR